MNAQIEAILYAAGEDGVDINTFSQLLGIAPTAVRQQLDLFMQGLNADERRGLTCRESDDRYFLLTKPELAPVLKRYFQGPPSTGLSQAALEVLAIIAYQQPVTRIEIDEVRGVQSSGALQTLVTRQLVEEAGRMDAPGRPIMYATSPQFLDYFGLHKLSDLPDLAELPAASDGTQLDLFERGDTAPEESAEEEN
mgnify:CR=1 FL=1